MRGRLLAFVATAMAAAAIFPPTLVRSGGMVARPTTVVHPVTGHATKPVPGRLLVKFRADTPRAARSSVERSLGAKLLRTIDPLGVRVLDVPNAKLGAILGTLRRDGRVEFVERDHLAAATQIPNDHYWLSEWSPVNTKATAAWDVTTGSPGVIVAVVDSGVDLSQPDLQGKLVAGWDFVNNDADPTDDNGHGTWVSGVVGAVTNNSIGVASYCWQCSIMPVKVLDSTAYGSYSNIASGIDWAVDHGARVINLSLAGTSPSDTLAAAVQYAHDKGAVVVAAAGNDGSSTQVYPAAYSEVLSVAGTDAGDALYSWSNYGSWVKVAAPGGNETTAIGGVYVVLVGTSSASPVVAGIAGLALSYAPTATNVQVEQAIETATVSIGSSVAYGRVDAFAALAALGAPGPDPSPSPSASSTPPPDPSPSPSPSPSESPSPSPTPSPTPTPSATSTSFSGALNSKTSSRTYTVATGSGILTATVTFKKASVLTLTILYANGGVIGTVTGGSGFSMAPGVSAGTYSFVVSGASSSFTLTATFPAP